MYGRIIIKWVLIAIGVTVTLGYSYFVFYDFIRGPRIILATPETGFATTTAHIVIVGRAVRINSLFLNGVAIPFDLEGNFSKSLLLAEGYNIMKITVGDKYKRTAEEIIEMTLLIPVVATTTATSTRK